MAAAVLVSSQLSPRASWEIDQTPKTVIPTRQPKFPNQTAGPTFVEQQQQRQRRLSATQLLSSTSSSSHREKLEESYFGFERWLPVAPKVKSPRSIYNAASLAYIGDCIYELYARRHFLFPPLSINDYNDRVMNVVRCEAQDALLKKLLSEDHLTEEERIKSQCKYPSLKFEQGRTRWGKNVATSKTRTKKRAGVAVYNSASSLETLIGYLYLTNAKRLEELMYRLGFSTGVSSEAIVELRGSSINQD